jgi:aminopeptidase-like protein
LKTNPLLSEVDLRAAGEWMHALIAELYPTCRSITGEGLRTTLKRLGREIPLEIHEVPTGTPVFDWTVPREWNIRDAWIKNPRGEKIVDFHKLNLHVLQYSVPVRRRLSLEELKPHLHTHPAQPDWVPYRTSYYKETWGFCLSQEQLKRLEPGEYEVLIDSGLTDGALSYGEMFLRGRTSAEVLFSCHVCHPSLANDNLSGVALLTKLAQVLAGGDLRYSYRFLFIPGTIGSITWLARNEERTCQIRHGLVAACVGDAGKLHYKRSRRGDSEIDRAVTQVLRERGTEHEVRDFTPYGYDERQYCSPGFNLPVGSLTRTPHGRFPEYHTSADNLSFVRAEALADSLDAYLAVLRILENNASYRNLQPKCEPQLGKRGLYQAIGGLDAGRRESALLWVLNLSDESHSLLEIAERSGLPFDLIHEAAQTLFEHRLLAECPAQ